MKFGNIFIRAILCLLNVPVIAGDLCENTSTALNSAARNFGMTISDRSSCVQFCSAMRDAQCLTLCDLCYRTNPTPRSDSKKETEASKASSDPNTTLKANEQLISAVRDGNFAQVVAAIESGANVNVPDEDGSLALFEAISRPEPLSLTKSENESENAKIIKLLIKRGAKLNRRNRNEVLPINHALKVGNADAVELIQEKVSEKSKRYSKKATIALFKAVRASPENLDAVKSAIEKGAILNAKADQASEEVEEIAGNPATALQYAVVLNRPKTVRMLLDSGADFLGKYLSKDPYGNDQLMLFAHEVNYAVIKGHSAVLREFLDFGLKANCLYWVGENISSPLHLAIENEQEKIVQILLKAGWNPNLSLGNYASNELTLLDLAEQRDNKKIVKMLKEAGGKSGKRAK